MAASPAHTSCLLSRTSCSRILLASPRLALSCCSSKSADDFAGKGSRSPRRQRNSATSKSTASRSRWRSSSSARWTRRVSRTRCRVSRGVSGHGSLLSLFCISSGREAAWFADSRSERKEGMELGEDDDFGIEIDNDEGPSRGAGRGGRGGPSGRGKSKVRTISPH